MLKIFDGRVYFYQWDLDQKLSVEYDENVCHVHFKNPDGETSLDVDTYTLDGRLVADVPNILLQKAGVITAWIYKCEGDECTIETTIFRVQARQKPSDYVYTETEVQSYQALAKRLDEIEANGVSDEQVEKAVTKYLDENPIDSMPPVTSEDEGKVLTVVDGVWAAKELPKYEGTYEITPLAGESTTLNTAQKFMDSDVTVKQIPYFETSNNSEGNTVYIGSEVEIYGD